MSSDPLGKPASVWTGCTGRGLDNPKTADPRVLDPTPSSPHSIGKQHIATHRPSLC